MVREKPNSIIEIEIPDEFNFNECLRFLARSELEVLHEVREGCVYKLLKFDGELILLKLGSNGPSITIEILRGLPSKNKLDKIIGYIREWFNLDHDLHYFYEKASKDRLLKPLVQKYYGLRIMCIPDLFEAITWAILGQQINLPFAYALKKRFVEKFGESVTFEGKTYWVYPEFKRIAELEIEDLRELQFTTRKAEYIIGVAKAMESGVLSKEGLLELKDYQMVHKSLTSIRGVGAWTADYVMMKSLQHPAAFPIADVGLHNALKNQLGLERKPTIDEIKELSMNWEGIQAYVTFYLWRSLYE